MTTRPERRGEKSPRFYLAAFGIAAWLTYMGWANWWRLLRYLGYSVNSLSAAELGDMFGGINALFAGVAFAALVTTLLMQNEQLQLQRDELRLQRQELEETRKEVKRQADALELNTKLLQLQTTIACRVAVSSYVLERQANNVQLQYEIIVRNPNPTTLRLERVVTSAIDKIEDTPNTLWRMGQDSGKAKDHQMQEVLYGAQRTFTGRFSHPARTPVLIAVAVFDQSGKAWGIGPEEQNSFKEAAKEFENDKSLKSLQLNIQYKDDGSFAGANWDGTR